MRKIVCLFTLVTAACSAAPGGDGGRNGDYEGPCLEFFKSRSSTAGDAIVRGSWERKGMIVVELARPAAAVDPVAKGALPDSPAAARHVAQVSPALGHCLVDPQHGTMRLPSAFDHSWDRDAG